jgi:hypothetical protein
MTNRKYHITEHIDSVNRDPAQYGADERWVFKEKRGACPHVNTTARTTVLEGLTFAQRIPCSQHILLCSQDPATGPYPAVFTIYCHWTISCSVHKILPLDHILQCSQVPATGEYPAVFTRSRHWTISSSVHKILPLDHILQCSQVPPLDDMLQCSQDPATGPYPAVFTRA